MHNDGHMSQQNLTQIQEPKMLSGTSIHITKLISLLNVVQGLHHIRESP